MTLSAELGKALPRIPHPIRTSRKSALEVEADKVARTFGGVPKDPEPSTASIDKVEQRLVRSPSALHSFSRDELRVVPHLIWGSGDRWRLDTGFVRDYLDVADRKWKAGLRRIWRHYLLNLDPACPATLETAAWFRERRGKLPELMKAFSVRHNLFEPERAPGHFARSLIDGHELTDELEELGLATGVLRTSAFCVSTLDAVGRLMPSSPGTSRVVDRLRVLLNGAPRNAIGEAVCAQPLRESALRSLVDGLVGWQEIHDPKDANLDIVLDFLLSLNGDPRFTPERWKGKVAPDSVSAVERWLSRKTIEAFFRVIDALKTDRPDMWQERRRFWLSYLPHVTKAWLVVGPDAVFAAEKEGLRFGKFAPGGGTQYDQCGLMLQIGELCVMEMNKNGSAIFWRPGARGLPGLYEESYRRSSYVNARDERDVFRMMHQGAWQDRFRSKILQMTGINVR